MERWYLLVMDTLEKRVWYRTKSIAYSILWGDGISGSRIPWSKEHDIENSIYTFLYTIERRYHQVSENPWSKEQDSQDTLLLFTLFFTGERWYPLVPGNPGVRSKNHRKLFTLLYNGERWYFQVLVHPGVENRIYRILFTLSYTGERWYLQVPRNPGVRSKVSGWRSNLYPQQELIQPVFHWLKQNFKYLFMNRKYELDKLLGNLWRWNRFNGIN